MAKARVTIPFQQTPAQSSTINTLVTDYITPGQLIITSTGFAAMLTTTGATATITAPAAGSWINLGWYPYNPAKQLYDRMDIIFNLHTSGTVGDLHVQYSLDSEASWTSANPGQSVFPLGIRMPAVIGGGTSLGPSYRTVDLSGVAAAGYIGLRILVDVTQQAFTWHASAFLYSFDDTPF